MSSHHRIIRPLEVRFRDLDAMGHVNNAVFFTYFEEGRKAFLEEVLGIVDAASYPFILPHIHCDYRAPLRISDRPALETWIGEIGKRKFSFRYRLTLRDDTSCVFGNGESVMVFYDYHAERSIPIPADVLEKMTPYVEEPGASANPP